MYIYQVNIVKWVVLVMDDAKTTNADTQKHRRDVGTSSTIELLLL
jgi:hypothetical protein